MFTFALPWLFLMLPLPLLVHWLVPLWRTPQATVQVPFFDELAALAGQRPGNRPPVSRRGWRQWLLLGLGWALLVTAAARPQWVEAPLVRTLPTRNVLLGVDLSASMLTKDFTDASGHRIDRLTAVKQVLDPFLQRREGDRVALIVFGTAPFVQVPFTADLDTVRALLDEVQVGMAGPRTAFGDAIGLAINLFRRSTLQNRLLIMLTDGNDSSSRLDPEKAAAIAGDEGIVIHTIGLGDPRTVGEQKLDERVLRGVARTTGGEYFWAGDRQALSEIYRRIDRLETHPVEQISYRPRRDLFYWPLGVLIGFSLLGYAGRRIRAGRRS